MRNIRHIPETKRKQRRNGTPQVLLLRGQARQLFFLQLYDRTTMATSTRRKRRSDRGYYLHLCLISPSLHQDLKHHKNATQTLQLPLFSQDTPFSQQNPWGCPSLQFSRRGVPFFEKSRKNYLITTRRMQNFGAGSFRSTWSRASPS